MMQNHNVIERAFAADDLEFRREFAASDDFHTLFGDMGFDEAYDRYSDSSRISASTIRRTSSSK